MVFRYKPGKHNLKKLLESAFKDCENRLKIGGNADIMKIFGKIKWPEDPVTYQKNIRDDRESPAI
ncbi:MAG: hypothetical protein EBV15_08755 [Bacteroidetes bacterium]|jgi:hypothetical protein|nr:hypothetical protein [Bacteroidota bacterium]